MPQLANYYFTGEVEAGVTKSKVGSFDMHFVEKDVHPYFTIMLRKG